MATTKPIDKGIELLKAFTDEKIAILRDNYEEFIFKEPLPEELKCLLCHKLAIPNHTAPCKHSFCKPCFDFIFVSLNCLCPQCDAPTGEWLKPSARVTIKSLNLDVGCPKTKYGCDVVKTLFEIPDHFVNCTVEKKEKKQLLNYDCTTPKYDGDIRNAIKYYSWSPSRKNDNIYNLNYKKQIGFVERIGPFPIPGLPFDAMVKFDFATSTAAMKLHNPGKDKYRVVPPYPRVSYTFFHPEDKSKKDAFTRTAELPFGHRVATNNEFHWEISFASFFSEFYNSQPDDVKVEIKADFPHIANFNYSCNGHIVWVINNYQSLLLAESLHKVDRHNSDYFYSHYDGYKMRAHLILEKFPTLYVTVLAGENDLRLPSRPRFFYVVKLLDENSSDETVLDRKTIFQDNPVFVVRLDKLKGWSPNRLALHLDITVNVTLDPYLHFEPRKVKNLSAEWWEWDIGPRSCRDVGYGNANTIKLYKKGEDSIQQVMAEEFMFMARTMRRPMSRMPIYNILRDIEERRFEEFSPKAEDKGLQKQEEVRPEPKSARVARSRPTLITPLSFQ